MQQSLEPLKSAERKSEYEKFTFLRYAFLNDAAFAFVLEKLVLPKWHL